jgi:hypothetical protein
MVDVDSLYGSITKTYRLRKQAKRSGRVPEKIYNYQFPKVGVPLVNYTIKEPARGDHEVPQKLLEHIEVDGQTTHTPNGPSISCQRNGHPKFNVLKQEFQLKGYGLRWWHTLVSLDALNKHLAGGVQYTKLREKTKARTKTTRKGKRSTRKRTKNVPLNIGGTKGKTY